MIREHFWRGNAEPRVNLDEKQRTGEMMIVAGLAFGKSD